MRFEPMGKSGNALASRFRQWPDDFGKENEIGSIGIRIDCSNFPFSLN